MFELFVGWQHRVGICFGPFTTGSLLTFSIALICGMTFFTRHNKHFGVLHVSVELRWLSNGVEGVVRLCEGVGRGLGVDWGGL